MKEVSTDRFYEIIGPLDVTVSTIGDRYPYKSVFKLRNGIEVVWEDQKFKSF